MDSFFEARTRRSPTLEPLPSVTLSHDSIVGNTKAHTITMTTTTTKRSVGENPKGRKPNKNRHPQLPQVSSMNCVASQHNGSACSQAAIITTTDRIDCYDIRSSCQPFHNSGATRKAALSTTPHESSSSTARAVVGNINTADTAVYSKTMKRKQQLLQAARNDAAEAFEREKDWILSQIPNSVQEIYGQIGFVKWSGKKMLLPALALNPYHVPPDPVRMEFLKRFEKARRNGRLDKLPLVVYWYGVTDESQMYSFITQRSFIPYEQGIAIKAAVIKGSARNEVEQDLAKEPSKRRRGVVGFVEGYQTLTLEEVEEVLVQGSVVHGVNGHATADLEVDEGKAKDSAEEWSNEVAMGISEKKSPKRDRNDDKKIGNNAAHQPNKDSVPKRRRVTRGNEDKPHNVSATTAMAEMEKILKQRDQARHQAEQKCNERLASLVATLSDQNAKLTRRINLLEQQNATQSQELNKQKVILAQRQREWFKEKEILKKQQQDYMEDLSSQHNHVEQTVKAENASLRASIAYSKHKEQQGTCPDTVRSCSSHFSSETNACELWL